MLYHDDPIFGDDAERGVSPHYPMHPPISAHPEPLTAGAVGWVAFGHLQAGDAVRTRALIDRTLAAERHGYAGATLVNVGLDDPLSRFLVDLTATHDPACFDYLTHLPFVFGAPASSWPWASCRFGTTDTELLGARSGELPGEVDTTVPDPVGVGLLMATYPYPQTQVGFDGFDVMRRYHVDAPDCVELCADLPSDLEQKQCAQDTVDALGELNSACVGGAPGLLGFQARSWPVQYMGFLPSGWSTSENGVLFKSVPRIVPTGGYQDARFGDGAFARFGRRAPDAAVPTCERADGSSVECPERVVLALLQGWDFDPPLAWIDGHRSFTVRLRYRNPPSDNGALIAYGVGVGGGTEQWDSHWIILGAAHDSWTTWEFTTTLDQSELNGVESLGRLLLVLRMTPTQPAHGWFDLDAVEVIDDATGEQLLPAEIGGFAADDYRTNRPGDFAADVIDRLGGVAAWGSSSHFMTGGWAYFRMDIAIPALFSGRSLGEALVGAGHLWSGLFFGDPLYRPVAVSLRASDSNRIAELGEKGGPTGLLVTAMDGTDDASLRWSLSLCPVDGADAATCTADSAWQPLVDGVGSVEDQPFDWTAWMPTGDTQRRWLVRLTAWPPGEPERALSSTTRIVADPGFP